jgi:DNA polymerase IV
MISGIPDSHSPNQTNDLTNQPVAYFTTLVACIRYRISMSERQRKIIHIDMDCFYAAVEMRDHPAFRDIPIAVGGAADRRGVIATCNYIARKFGVHSAMATAHAMRLCPNLKVIPGRMSYYQEISRQIRSIFERYTDIIEPLSLDEAYLDVTDSKLFKGSATLIAEDLRAAIHRELDLTASAGIAPNKFLAKICSDENKPDGQYVVTPSEIDMFVRALPLRKIPGVGKVTEARLSRLGLQTCDDVRKIGEEKLVREFGGLGRHLLKRSHGIDNSELVTQWIRKSLSVEQTYAEDIPEPQGALASLDELFEELLGRLEKHQDRPIKNQQVKLKFSNFRQTTMERASTQPDKALFSELLPLAWDRGNGLGIRLLGLGVMFQEPQDKPQQLDMFENGS